MRWQLWRSIAAPVTVSFPGTTAKVSLSDRESSGGHWFTMIHDRHSQQVTVVFEVLAEPQVWTRLFSMPKIMMGEARDVLAVSATWDAYSPDRLSLRIAITFAVVSKRGRRDLGDQAVEVGIRLPGVIGSLLDAGLPVRPLDTNGFTATVLEALTGSAHGDVDALAQAWASVSQSYTCAHHGDADAVSLTLAPRHVTAETLATLCLPAAPKLGGLRTTVTYRPVDLDDTEGVDAPHTLGLFGAIVTVTSTDPGDPDASGAVNAVRSRLPLAVRLGLRRGYASQAALLAASFGIGVLLPDSVELPATTTSTSLR